MKLEKRHKEKVTAWLHAKWSDNKCPICSSRNWSLTDRVFELREFAPDAGWIGLNDPLIENEKTDETVVPLITVTCSVCGNTVFLSALVLELIDHETGRLTDE